MGSLSKLQELSYAPLTCADHFLTGAVASQHIRDSRAISDEHRLKALLLKHALKPLSEHLYHSGNGVVMSPPRAHLIPECSHKHPSTQAPKHPSTQAPKHPSTQAPKHPSTQAPKHVRLSPFLQAYWPPTSTRTTKGPPQQSRCRPVTNRRPSDARSGLHLSNRTSQLLPNSA